MLNKILISVSTAFLGCLSLYADSNSIKLEPPCPECYSLEWDIEGFTNVSNNAKSIADRFTAHSKCQTSSKVEEKVVFTLANSYSGATVLVENLLTQGHFDAALSMCGNDQDLLSSIINYYLVNIGIMEYNTVEEKLIKHFTKTRPGEKSSAFKQQVLAVHPLRKAEDFLIGKYSQGVVKDLIQGKIFFDNIPILTYLQRKRFRNGKHREDIIAAILHVTSRNLDYAEK